MPAIYSYEEYADTVLVYGYCTGIVPPLQLGLANTQTPVFQTTKRSAEPLQVFDEQNVKENLGELLEVVENDLSNSTRRISVPTGQTSPHEPALKSSFS